MLKAIIDHLKLRRVALWAVSTASPTVIPFAVRHTARVSRLALFCAWARSNGEPVGAALKALTLAEHRLVARPISLIVAEAAG